MSSSFSIGRDTSWPWNCHPLLVTIVASLKSVSFVSDGIQGSRAVKGGTKVFLTVFACVWCLSCYGNP